MQSRKISINQLVIFVVFLSAALITSLFVYHLSHKPEKSDLPPERGILFPAARDIKSFELMTAENKAFTLENFYHHWSLVFFGFTHCASVCPTTLDLMKHVYNKLHA
ncbi:MAG: SCO family protein, partial [Gammaproteobacteria bacterium]|nr:SCO family protein [Gammaproteobacteria bacterium]